MSLVVGSIVVILALWPIDVSLGVGPMVVNLALWPINVSLAIISTLSLKSCINFEYKV